MIRWRLFDCGSKIGLALCIGSWRRAWWFRNPFWRWDESKGGPRPSR